MKLKIRYGSEITLRHVNTNAFLKSSKKHFIHVRTSGQQMVVGSRQADNDCVWIVKGMHSQSSEYEYGSQVRSGSVIRLMHKSTELNLHSHGDRRAPVSPDQQEVTAFGAIGHGDPNDEWILECPFDQNWKVGQVIKLDHRATGHYLHSHAAVSHPVHTDGLQEVTCYKWKDDNDNWSVATVNFEDKFFTVSAATSSKWINVLGIASAIASISGWSFVSLQTSFSQTKLSDDVGIVLSVLLTVSALAITIEHFHLLYARNVKQRGLNTRLSVLAISAVLLILALVFMRYLIQHIGLALGQFIRFCLS